MDNTKITALVPVYPQEEKKVIITVTLFPEVGQKKAVHPFWCAFFAALPIFGICAAFVIRELLSVFP